MILSSGEKDGDWQSFWSLLIRVVSSCLVTDILSPRGDLRERWFESNSITVRDYYSILFATYISTVYSQFMLMLQANCRRGPVLILKEATTDSGSEWTVGILEVTDEAMNGWTVGGIPISSSKNNLAEHWVMLILWITFQTRDNFPVSGISTWPRRKSCTEHTKVCEGFKICPRRKRGLRLCRLIAAHLT